MATSKTVVGSIDNPGKPGGQGFESPQARGSEAFSGGEENEN